MSEPKSLLGIGSRVKHPAYGDGVVIRLHPRPAETLSGGAGQSVWALAPSSNAAADYGPVSS